MTISVSSISNYFLKGVTWLKPHTWSDYGLLALTAACSYYGGLLGGGSVFCAYLMNRWRAKPVETSAPDIEQGTLGKTQEVVSKTIGTSSSEVVSKPDVSTTHEIAPPTPSAVEEPDVPLKITAGNTGVVVVEEIPDAVPQNDSPDIPLSAPTLAPDFPKFRSAEEDEAKLAVGIDDPIYFDTLPIENQGNTCFAAALAQTFLLSQWDAINSRKAALENCSDDRSKKELEHIDPLIAFIASYRKATKKGEAVEIDPIIEVLQGITNNSIYVDLPTDIIDSDINVQKTKAEIASLEAIDEEDINEEEKEKLQVALQKARNDLASYERIIRISSRRVEAQDAYEMIEHLYTLIHGNPEELLQQAWLFSGERLRTAPQQLILPFRQLNLKKIDRIDEIMEVSGNYFADSKPAIYRLDGIIHHESDHNHHESDHNWAVVRKFDRETRQSFFVNANDSRIMPIESTEMGAMLNEASQAYVLLWTKIA